MTLRLNLGQYLKDHGISAYRLVQEVRGQVAPNTVYALARRPAQRIDLRTVGELLRGLERLAGQKVSISDVLEDVLDSAAAPTLEHLLAQVPQAEQLPAKRFSYSGRGRRVDVSGGPSIVQIVSEGRDR